MTKPPLLGLPSVKESACQLETRVLSVGWEDFLEKETASHSNTLAWGIPWTEEPNVLQPMGSQRVGHDLVTERQQQLLISKWACVFCKCTLACFLSR